MKFTEAVRYFLFTITSSIDTDANAFNYDYYLCFVVKKNVYIPINFISNIHKLSTQACINHKRVIHISLNEKHYQLFGVSAHSLTHAHTLNLFLEVFNLSFYIFFDYDNHLSLVAVFINSRIFGNTLEYSITFSVCNGVKGFSNQNAGNIEFCIQNNIN